MTMIALPIPEEVRQQLSKIKVPGKKLDPAQYHITLFSFEKQTSDDIVKIFEILLKSLKKEKTFNIKLSKVSTFEITREGTPIIALVESKALMELRAFLARKFDKAGIEYNKQYQYTPHLTLSYGDKKDKGFECDFNPINFKPTSVNYYGGSQMHGLMIRVPFGSK